YYMFYTAEHDGTGNRNACVAKSSSPDGPFTEIKAPLIPGSAYYLDCHPYHDPASGKWFLFIAAEGRVPNEMFVARLSDSLVDLETTLTRCFVPDQQWEHGWVEAPSVFLHRGK